MTVARRRRRSGIWMETLGAALILYREDWSMADEFEAVLEVLGEEDA
jgi:hypothetical protein